MNDNLRFILLKEQLLDALHLWATVTTEERGDITLPEAISRWQKDQVK